MQQQVPGWLSFLSQFLGEHRAGFVASIVLDIVTLVIAVSLLIATTLLIQGLAGFFSDDVPILPYIKYVHEGVVVIGIMALSCRAILEMWNFATKGDR